MAILVGSSGSAAEFPFAIYSHDNVPTTGYTFTTGDVQYRMPGGVLVDADIDNIVECGLGQYVLQLTSAQTAAEGMACIVFDDGGANRPYSEFEQIADTTDELLEVPFAIYNGAMVGQAGFSFTNGDLQIRLPDEESFSDADVGNIEDLGGGQYVLVLTVGERANPGAIMVYFEDGVNQPYYRYELNALETAEDEDEDPTPIPAPAEAASLPLYEHSAAMLNRLPEYARQEV